MKENRPERAQEELLNMPAVRDLERSTSMGTVYGLVRGY